MGGVTGKTDLLYLECRYVRTVSHRYDDPVYHRTRVNTPADDAPADDAPRADGEVVFGAFGGFGSFGVFGTFGTFGAFGHCFAGGEGGELSELHKPKETRLYPRTMEMYRSSRCQ